MVSVARRLARVAISSASIFEWVPYDFEQIISSPLGGSISLKFLLETRLQSESFDTLDDLLGFRVQKL